MRILVTGATGRIGRSLIQAAQTRGAEVVAVARALSQMPRDAGGTQVPTIQVPDIVTWHATGGMGRSRLDAVIHLAGIAAANAPVDEIQRTNVDGAVNVAKQAAVLGARRLVFVSSIKAVGEESREGYPLSPDSPCRPEDAYGRSKLAAEKQLRDLCQELDVELVIVRPPMVYGPANGGNFSLLARAVKSGVPLPLGRALAPRSYVSVDNLSDFLLQCATHPQAAGETFHVSDMQDSASSELAREIGRAVNQPVRLVPVPAIIIAAIAKFAGRENLARSLFGRLEVDSCKAQELLGWTPPVARSEALSQYFRHPSTAPTQGLTIRVIDRLLAGVGLVVSAPVGGVICGLGLMDTGSPFFVQERVGRDERLFRLVKFRTMSRDTLDLPTHLAPHHSVTHLGRFLRSSKLDELPQLWNVLRGEMSFVGPRPCLPSQTELREARRALGVDRALPGITGLGQIEGVDMSEPQLLASLDAEMMANLSLTAYTKYLVLTALGRGRGDRVRVSLVDPRLSGPQESDPKRSRV